MQISKKMSIPQNKHYVILRHVTPAGTHWDFMLEKNDHLATWRINIPPEQLRSTPADAEKIFDHPKKFLTYEGPVNKGIGKVSRQDKGTYTIINETPEKLQIRINANILNGNYTLRQNSKDIWLIENR